MSTKNPSTAIVDDIINHASRLPQECQELILMMAKGMAFTKKCMTEQEQKQTSERKRDEVKRL